MIEILLLSFAPTAATLPLVDLPAVLQAEPLDDVVKRFNTILKSKKDEGEAIKMMDDFVVRYRGTENEIEGIDADLEAGAEDASHLKYVRRGKVKELEEIAEAVYHSLVHKSRRKLTENNMQMWKAAAYSLGQMGENGADLLYKAFELKKFRDEPEMRGLFLEQIGYTHAYEAYIEELVDLLDHSEYLFIAKASDALAQFADAPGKVRKKAVSRLSKLVGQYYEDTITNKSDEEAQRKYRMTGRPMQNALKALTGVDLDGPLEWTTWWNKNKNDSSHWTDPS